MPPFICTNQKCDNSKTSFEMKKLGPCPKCGKKVNAATAPTQGETFESLVAKVQKALPSYLASHQKKVIDYLEQNKLAGYKADFVSEMKKEEDFSKFVGKKTRENTKTTNCFDNSFVRYAGAKLPDLCPVGEKFDFEMPYILNTFGWKYLGNATKCFTTAFSTLLKTLREGYSYLVATRVNPQAAIGHVITLYVPGKNQVWLHDPQMLAIPGGNEVCEAWESGNQLGSLQKPGCYLNVKTGKMEGDWEKG